MANSVLAKLDLSTPEKVLHNVHWTEENLASALGVHITHEYVAEVLEGFWAEKAAWNTGHAKKYVHFEAETSWCEGGLVGFVGEYSGIKDIHFGRDNRTLNLPVSHADMFIRNKDTGKRLMTLECITISDYRTGWFALAFVRLVMQGMKDIDVVVIGSGPVATACIYFLNVGAADQIKSLTVLSKSGVTNKDLVEKLQYQVKFTLIATDDRKVIPEANYLITATNAGIPVVEEHEIGENTKVLSQGIDDLPAAYIKRLIDQHALIVGDDLKAMEERNVDPLALFYSRQNKKLTKEGKADGVKEYAYIMTNAIAMDILNGAWDGPACFLPVGLTGYDLMVAIKVYKDSLAAITTEFKAKGISTGEVAFEDNNTDMDDPV